MSFDVFFRRRQVDMLGNHVSRSLGPRLRRLENSFAGGTDFEKDQRSSFPRSRMQDLTGNGREESADVEQR